MFDLVVPVHNAMHHARSCIASIFETANRPFHLYVVDDASGPHTARGLEELLGEHDPARWTLLRNETNLGYLQSANKGARAGGNPFIVFVNSDTVSTPGCLEKLEAAFARDLAIAVVNAVSNWANWTRVCWRLPDGHNVRSLARAVEAASSRACPDIGSASGFYFATRRNLFEELGGFDEAYGFGYWEETDYCMRALEAGRRVVVDDSLYIYHHGWGTFQEGGRSEHMQRNKALFMERWGPRYAEVEARWKRGNPISYMEPGVLERKKNEPAALRRVAPAKQADSQARRFPISVREARERLDHLMDLDTPAEAVQAAAEEARARAVPPEDRTRVLYILPAVQLYGGVISVLQVVNQLVLRGFDANVVTYGDVDEEAYKLFPMFFRAHHYESMDELIADFPDADVAVATAWETAYAAQVLRERRPALRVLYFVQDYEPDFYTGAHPDLEEKARRTYYLIRDQIVKTRWLARQLEPFEGRVHRIPLGLNLDYFHDYENPRPPQVLALGRPSSVRRNFNMACEVFAELHRHRPDLQFAFYGHGYDATDLPFPCRDYGPLKRMEDVAAALNESTVLLDASTFQGFGRPGLEAMACGTAAVLTREGGITQYAKHEYNCLLIDPGDRDDIAGKVLELVDNPDKRARLVARGLETAREYAVTNEGRRTAALLRALLDGELRAGTGPEDWDGAKPGE